MTAAAARDVRPLRVLVVGGLGTSGAAGGREHAIAWAAARSPRCEALFCAPANGGMPGTAVSAGTDLVEFCAVEQIDLAIIGPDAAIEAGIVDRLIAAGVMTFGPTQAAAELEWSKAYTRAFCERHGIASPRSATFTDPDAAIAWAATAGFAVVVKADGLAAGKGVLLPADRTETEAAIRSILIDGAFGTAGARVVLEERLFGEEISLLAFCDGITAVAMPPAQDHKRAYEGDRGPNTGGMGAYAPAPACPSALAESIAREMLQKAVTASAAEGRPFVGVLYAGIMLTAHGPRLLEFNCRFGDPEAQVLLPLLDTDFLDVAEACCTGSLASLDVTWWNGAAVTVVIAADGYPGTVRTGDRVHGLDNVGAHTGVLVFHGGTRRDESGEVDTTAGRVLSITGLGATVAEARTRAYDVVGQISFEGMNFRRDIGWRALARTTGGYAASGVDIDAGNEAVALIKTAVESTHTPAVLSGVGAFGGVFDAKALLTLHEPVLVASTDGVGTKVALAAEAGRLSGVGRDLVNHCVNDVLVQNARPLFFLDYVASARLVPSEVADIVGGMAAACRENGCALLGGETAEMPGVYHDGHVDVAGTLIGMAERSDLLPRSGIAPGDVLLGLGSSGPHTNGYSLLRRVFAGLPLSAQPEPLDRPLGDALLEPHRSYLPVLAPLLDGPLGPKVKGLIHITGGGFQENIPRVLPEGCGASVIIGSWPVPPLFQLIRDASGLPADELHRTLNMGIGMIVIVAAADVEAVSAALRMPAWVIGSIVADEKREVVLT